MFTGPGHVLAAKYQLSRQLGQGGMGSVWLAEHLTLRSPVAIKLIEPSIAANPEALARFLREAQAAASLRSPHVVQILDYGVDDGIPFIAMEVLEGESLAGRLERVGRLTPAETSRIMTHVGRAMTRAHDAQIVHRDLKPDNIFIVHNDEEDVAKVLDFGVAKSNLHGLGAAASTGTRTGAVLGTPYYMSPEQAEGIKSLDHRTDIWAMGVITWECLLGAKPFEAETLGSLLLAICAREIPIPSHMGPVPPGFDAWFARACARDSSQRFGSAKEAAAELRRVCGDAPLAAAPTTSSSTQIYHAPARTGSPLAGTTGNLNMSATAGPPLAPPSNKTATAVIAGVALGVVGLAAIGGVLLLRREPPSVASETPAVSSSPVVAAAPVIAATPATSTPEALAPSSVPSSPTPVATPSAVPPAPNAALPALGRLRPAPLASSKPQIPSPPAAPPAAATPTPPAAAHPAAAAADVNLGI